MFLWGFPAFSSCVIAELYLAWDISITGANTLPTPTLTSDRLAGEAELLALPERWQRLDGRV